MLNAPGTIDEDYRGEIGVVLINHGDQPFVVQPRMRIAQLVIAPVVWILVQIDLNKKATNLLTGQAKVA